MFMSQHGAHLGPTRPRLAPCWPHEPCYLGTITKHNMLLVIVIGHISDVDNMHLEILVSSGLHWQRVALWSFLYFIHFPTRFCLLLNVNIQRYMNKSYYKHCMNGYHQHMNIVINVYYQYMDIILHWSWMPRGNIWLQELRHSDAFVLHSFQNICLIIKLLSYQRTCVIFVVKTCIINVEQCCKRPFSLLAYSCSLTVSEVNYGISNTTVLEIP